jgi:sulfide:quinone oxidoreductase
MVAEFAYGGKVTPSFPFMDPRKSCWFWWLGKTWGFPWMYWQLMLKGYRLDIPHKASYAEKLTKDDS